MVGTFRSGGAFFSDLFGVFLTVPLPGSRTDVDVEVQPWSTSTEGQRS